MNVKLKEAIIILVLVATSLLILVGAFQIGVKQGESNAEYMESDEHANWSQTLTKQAGEIFDLEEEVDRLEKELAE